MGGYLDKLSEFVAGTHYDRLSQEASEAVKDITLDTLGAIVAGSRLPENAALAQLLARRSGPATATIFGHPLKAEPMLTAMFNSTAGVSLEVDEGNSMGGGHPSVHCLPGAIAVAEEMGASGPQLMESVLVGYEVQSRLGGATVLRDNVHPHGLWGTIGTAVAVSKLRGYTAGQIRDVINLAASMSPANTWAPCFEGGTIRNLYPGRAGLQGILAIHLYECGYTGIEDGPSDVLNTFHSDTFDPEAAVEGLGDDYRVQYNYYKFYACCRFNHPAVGAALSIRRKQSFNLEQVEDVDVTTVPHPRPKLERYPENMLAAKFSIPYSVAAAIVRGNAGLDAFSPEAIDDDRIRALEAKVHVKSDPDWSLRRHDRPTARVSIRLESGQVLSETTNVALGDMADPAPRQLLLDKFMSLTKGVLGEEQSRVVLKTTERLEQLADVRELTALLGG